MWIKRYLNVETLKYLSTQHNINAVSLNCTMRNKLMLCGTTTLYHHVFHHTQHSGPQNGPKDQILSFKMPKKFMCLLLLYK